MRYFQARISENRALGRRLLRPAARGLCFAGGGKTRTIRNDSRRLGARPAAAAGVLADVGRAGGRDGGCARQNRRSRHRAARAGAARGRARRARAARDELPGARGPIRIDLLVAGGVGLPPLYMQGELAAAQRLVARSEMLYGGRGAPDLVLLAEMKAMGLALHLTTEDGARRYEGPGDARARGPPGRAIAASRVRVMGCGPNAMLWAVARHRARARASRASSRWKSRWRAASASASAARFRRARALTATSAATAPCSTPPTCSTSKPSAAPRRRSACPA